MNAIILKSFAVSIHSPKCLKLYKLLIYIIYETPRKRPANAYCHCNKQSFNSGQQNEQSECDWSNLQTSIFNFGSCDTQGVKNNISQ